MMKTAQYFVQSSARHHRQHEKLRKEWKTLSATVAVYILLVAVSTLVGAAGEYDLAGDCVNGFALWFLLLPAYLPLAIISFFRWWLNLNIEFSGKEAYLLGICDTILAVITWISISLVSFKMRRPAFLHTTKNFLKILIFWGFFQLGCCAARGLWENGGFAPLHHDTGAAIYPGRK